MSAPKTLRSRLLLGQHQRKHMRRAEHAGWNPKLRTESPLDLLRAAEKDRVPALLRLKHQLMAGSPFAFFRGAVPVMAYDLSLSPNTGIHNQICGDAHARNLGAFASPAGPLVFDINDFDETTHGPFEWDVKRLATSFILAGRDAHVRESQSRDAAAAMLASYRDWTGEFARMPLLQVARHQVHRLEDVEPFKSIIEAAERSTPMHNLARLTLPNPETSAQPRRIFKDDPPQLRRLTGEEAQGMIDALPTYIESLLPERRHLFARYTLLDVAFKVVGTGSVGLLDYCLYFQGNGSKDPLFLQIKEEARSAYAPYLGQLTDAPAHQGRRVVEGERAMQFQSDPFLGWTRMKSRDFIVRQLNDHKASVDLTALKFNSLHEYAAVCGELLARGHARSGDAAILAGYLGESPRFDQAVLKFAVAYADQTDRDWKAFTHALKLRPGTNQHAH